MSLIEQPQRCSAFSLPLRVEVLIGSSWTNEGAFKESEAQAAKDLLRHLREHRTDRTYRLIALAYEVIEP